jgi:uncharacterized membrane protein HdeD (DUF308 family)
LDQGLIDEPKVLLSGRASRCVLRAEEHDMPTTLERELAGKVWRVGVIRGIIALAVGGYVMSQSAASLAVIARACGAYWIVDGLIALWAAAFAATLTLSRLLVLLRGGIAIAAGLTLFALPLGMVFGPWQPGQVVLLMIIAGVMLAVIGAQMLVAVLDVMLCLEVRRRIPGEWSCAIGAALSAGFAVIAAATLAAPAPLLSRALGIMAVIGGLGVLVTAARLRGGPEPSPVSAYPNKR